jgi:ABC-type branched-subunit amino acid transport system substrate-binding protein
MLEPDRDRSSRRKIIKATGASLIGATLAGCQSLDEGSSAEANSDQTPASDVPDDALAGETLTIGGMYPLPDDYVIGRDAARGTELAIREANRSENGILGADAEHLVGDTNISPATARQVTEKFIVEEDADVINGGFLGQVYRQMLAGPISTHDTLSFFSCGASVPVGEMVRDNFDGYRMSFRSICNMRQARNSELHFLDLWADEMGWDKIAVLTEDMEVFDAVAEPLAEGIEERGIAEVPYFQRTSQGILDWAPLFDRAESEDVDLLCVNLVLTGVTAARQWGNQERDFDMGGIHLHAMAPDFWENHGGVAETLWTMNMGGFDSSQTSRMTPMMDRFEEEFGYKTSSYSCFCAYDATRMWFDAVRAVGSTEPEDLIPYLEDRVWEGSVIDEAQEFQGPNGDFPHDWKYRGYEGFDAWNQQGWLPFTQWQGEKGGEANMVTVAPPKASPSGADLNSPGWQQ